MKQLAVKQLAVGLFQLLSECKYNNFPNKTTSGDYFRWTANRTLCQVLLLTIYSKWVFNDYFRTPVNTGITNKSHKIGAKTES